MKLLGRSIAAEDGTVTAYVEPHLVPVEEPLAGVDDVFNAILVKGDATGDVMFYGRGAGKLPTASAVVADVIAAVRKLDRASYRPWQPNRPELVGSVDALVSPWFVRTADGAEITAPMVRAQAEAAYAGAESLIRVLA